MVLGTLTNMTMAGCCSAVERLAQMVLGLLGPVIQAVYRRASLLAASSRQAALEFTRRTLLLMGSVGFGMSAILLLAAPSVVAILLDARFLASVTIMRVLSPLPFLIALSNVLGIQVMVPFKPDVAFTVILVAAGLFNVGLASLLTPHWQGNGMAFSVTCSEFLVTTAMFLYLGRRRMLPLRATQEWDRTTVRRCPKG